MGQGSQEADASVIIGRQDYVFSQPVMALLSGVDALKI